MAKTEMFFAIFYFVKIDLQQLDDKKVVKLIYSRWDSSHPVWEEIKKIYDRNSKIYANEAEWVSTIPKSKTPVLANRIFVNTEAVINSLIANPASINFVPTRQDEIARDIAQKKEKFFQKKFKDINFKETMRMGLRNLYFGRLLAIKAFWNSEINDFDFKSINPNNVRFAKSAKNEAESEFVIEEVEDNAIALLARFPEKKEELLKEFGKSEEDLYITNPMIKYKEAWIGDYLMCVYGSIVLSKDKNPYFDWDGIMATKEEYSQLTNSIGQEKRVLINSVKTAGAREGKDLQAYYYNYFDQARKPYIFATIFNNEDKPIGRTDMISLAAPLQRSIDKRKQDIDENCDLVNGIVKVDKSVMTKKDAQGLRYEAKGIIYGNNVKDGVTRETGEPLPAMVFEDMQDSRNEIDNIMAATSAFKGQREGQETKAGRLALIEQSYLRLNELVQVVDYVYQEAFKWAYQLAKIYYLEEHYAKWTGTESAQEIIAFMQDDFLDGTDIDVIPGKSLPMDSQFRYERAQADVQAGLLAPEDYFKEANYNNPQELAKNRVLYDQNPAQAVGITPEEMPMPFEPGVQEEPAL